MTRVHLRRILCAIAVAVAALGVAGTASLAQADIASNVTIGGGTSGVGEGDVIVIAPGVTINGGEVLNETGIDVIIGGGSSVGGATGGGDNATLVD